MDYMNNLAVENNYRAAGDTFWKRQDGYLLVMTAKENVVYIEIRTGIEKGVMPAIVSRKVSDIAEEADVKECIVYNNSIILSIEKDRMSAYGVEAKTEQIIALLEEAEIAKIYQCQVCGESLEGTDNVMIKVNNHLAYVHKSCYEKLKEENRETESAPKGSYLTGFIGSFIAGAIGAIPWFILGILGWVVSYFGLLIGIAANFGYNKFRGRQGKVKSIILIAIIVIMVVSAQIATDWYQVMGYFGDEGIIGVPPIEGLKFILEMLISDGQYMGRFAINCGLGLLFGILGSWRFIMASATDKSKAGYDIELIEE